MLMTGYWLPGATRYDLSGSHGYGPALQRPVLGVVLHVNQSNGRLENFFANSTEVCPTFQVYKAGPPTQYLPLDWQPWCQMGGNQQYGAIETEGYVQEALNGNQLDWISQIVAAFHEQLGVPLQLADAPGQAGFGWHGMGGDDWGGHPACPGDIRKAQRQVVLDGLTQPAPTPPAPQPEDEDMADQWWADEDGDGKADSCWLVYPSGLIVPESGGSTPGVLALKYPIANPQAKPINQNTIRAMKAASDSLAHASTASALAEELHPLGTDDDPIIPDGSEALNTKDQS